MAVFSQTINIGQFVPSAPATMSIAAVGAPQASSKIPSTIFYTPAAPGNLVVAGFSSTSAALPTALSGTNIAWTSLGTNATASAFYGVASAASADTINTGVVANNTGAYFVQEFASSIGSANIGWVLLGGANGSGSFTGGQGITGVPLTGNGVNGVAVSMAEQIFTKAEFFSGSGPYTWAVEDETAAGLAQGQLGYLVNATGTADPSYSTTVAGLNSTNVSINALLSGFTLSQQIINDPIQPVPSGLIWVVSMVSMEAILAGGAPAGSTPVTANIYLNNRLVIGNLNAIGGIYQGPPYIPMSSKDMLTVSLSALITGSQYVVNLYYDEYPASESSAYALSRS